MTEGEWLKGRYPGELLYFMGRKVGKRRRRLIACACCRRIWPTLGDERSRRAVEVAELFADGVANEEELAAAHRAANWADLDLNVKIMNYPVRQREGPWRVWKAAVAAKHAANEYRPDVALEHARDAVYDGSLLDREHAAQAVLVRDILGNPFRPVAFDPAWRTPTAVALAQAIVDERAFERMPILADALEEAGCASRDVLKHCRGKGPHARGCWVLDLVLGKEP